MNEICPDFPRALDVVGAVLADMILQPCVDIGGSAAGLADWDGGPTF